MTFFVPKTMFPHTKEKFLGSFVMPVFWTLKELRKHHPEPIEYFTIDEVETPKE